MLELGASQAGSMSSCLVLRAVWHWWGLPRALHADRPASSSSSASFSCNPWESDFHLLFLTIKGHESTLVGSGEVFHVPL